MVSSPPIRGLLITNQISIYPYPLEALSPTPGVLIPWVVGDDEQRCAQIKSHSRRDVSPTQAARSSILDFPKITVPYFGVLVIRILLFRVLY